jgi:cytochrome c nitrite reductase small subunit
MKKPSGLVSLTAILLGAFVGLGIYTAYYSKAYSYLLDDPKACMNCHVMKDAYDGWRVSSHRSVTCNECHTPHDMEGIGRSDRDEQLRVMSPESCELNVT